MTTQEKISQYFESKLGSDEFVRSGKLIEIGLFRTHGSLAKAIAEGLLPSIKVSPHRTLIPRLAVLDFIKKNTFGSPY